MLLILFATVFFTTVYGQTNNDQCPYDPRVFCPAIACEKGLTCPPPACEEQAAGTCCKSQCGCDYNWYKDKVAIECPDCSKVVCPAIRCAQGYKSVRDGCCNKCVKDEPTCAAPNFVDNNGDCCSPPPPCAAPPSSECKPKPLPADTKCPDSQCRDWDCPVDCTKVLCPAIRCAQGYSSVKDGCCNKCVKDEPVACKSPYYIDQNGDCCGPPPPCAPPPSNDCKAKALPAGTKCPNSVCREWDCDECAGVQCPLIRCAQGYKSVKDGCCNKCVKDEPVLCKAPNYIDNNGDCCGPPPPCVPPPSPDCKAKELPADIKCPNSVCREWDCDKCAGVECPLIRCAHGYKSVKDGCCNTCVKDEPECAFPAYVDSNGDCCPPPPPCAAPGGNCKAKQLDADTRCPGSRCPEWDCSGDCSTVICPLILCAEGYKSVKQGCCHTCVKDEPVECKSPSFIDQNGDCCGPPPPCAPPRDNCKRVPFAEGTKCTSSMCPQYDCDEDCSAVLCAQVECQDGYTRTKQGCCDVCVKEEEPDCSLVLCPAIKCATGYSSVRKGCCNECVKDDEEPDCSTVRCAAAVDCKFGVEKDGCCERCLICPLVKCRGPSSPNCQTIERKSDNGCPGCPEYKCDGVAASTSVQIRVRGTDIESVRAAVTAALEKRQALIRVDEVRKTADGQFVVTVKADEESFESEEQLQSAAEQSLRQENIDVESIRDTHVDNAASSLVVASLVSAFATVHLF